MTWLKSVAKRLLPERMVDSIRFLPRRNSAFIRDEYRGRYDFLRKALLALKYNGIEGDYAEFGCCGANTFRMVHRVLSTYPYRVGPFHMWAFDSFRGLPKAAVVEDAHPIWVEGTMAIELAEFNRLCQSCGMSAGAYTTVPGFYEESLSPTAAGPRPGKIRLAYVDCDMYSSTKAVLQFLKPRMQHGMIIAFDDYYCYSSEKPSGERLAAAEEFAANPTWRLVPYVQYGWHGMSFVVEAVGEGKPSGNHNSHW